MPNYPGSLPAVPKPTATTREDDGGFFHDTVHTRLSEEIDALAAELGLDSDLVSTAVRHLLSNVATGHHHDNVDSRRVVYGDLGSIPATFPPAVHARSAHSTAMRIQKDGGALSDILDVNITGAGATVGVAGSLATVDIPGGGAGATLIGLPHHIIRKNGANFEGINMSTGAVEFSATDGGAVVNSALGASPGAVGVVAGTIITEQTGINVGDYQTLYSSNGLQEGFTSGTIIRPSAGLAAGESAVELATASRLSGIAVNGNANADYALRCKGVRDTVDFCLVGNGKLISLWLDGPSGCNRAEVFDTIVDNASNAGGTSFRVDGSDHIIGDFRVTGAATNGYALVVSGQHAELANGHVTAAAACLANTLVDNTDNGFANVTFDTGPDGTNGRKLLKITGGNNRFSACEFWNSKLTTSAAVCIQKASAGAFVQGNLFIGCRWDGSGIVFASCVEFLDESDSLPTSMARFAGTKVIGGSATSVTAPTNVDLSNTGLPFASLIRFRDLECHQQDTSTPVLWATDAYGRYIANGDGSTTAFQIPHLMGLKPSAYSLAQLTNSGRYWVSNTSTTFIEITFVTAPGIGVSNIVFSWRAWI